MPVPGRSLRKRTKRNKQIAVIINGLTNEYQSTLCHGIEAMAHSLDFGVSFFSPDIRDISGNILPGDFGELNILHLPLTHPYDAMIVLTNTLPQNPVILDRVHQLICARDIPIVSIGTPLEGTYNVDLSDNGRMDAVVRHLIQHHGVMDLGFVTGPAKNQDSLVRFAAWQAVLDECGIALQEDRVFCGDFIREKGIDAVRFFLNSEKGLPQAIVCANDDMALGIFLELSRRRIRVPEDVLLTGYDFIHEARYNNPQLTSVKVPLFDMGQKAVETIARLFKGQAVAASCLFDTEPVYSASCGCRSAARVTKREIIREMGLKAENMQLHHNATVKMMTMLSGEYTLEIVTSGLLSLLPSLGVRRFYLCLNHHWIESESPEDIGDHAMRMLIGYQNGHVMRDVLFDDSRILPEGFEDAASALVFSSLYHGDRDFGYLVYDLPSSSSFLQNILLRNIRMALENLRVQNVLKHYSRQMEELNQRDPLTGTYNRRGLLNKVSALLEESARENRNVAVIFADLDNLKKINDAYGHSAGDSALIELTRALLQCSHENDIIARVGGDEFVMIGSADNEEFIRSHVFSLQSRLKLYNEFSQKPYSVSASFGWYLKSPQDNIVLSQMIEIADRRLYEAKQLRRLSTL